MKTSPLVLSALLATLALVVSPPQSAAMTLSLDDNHVRWAEHHDLANARFAITTEDGKVTLLITDREVAVQLSERMVHRVQRKLRNKTEEQDNPIGMAIVSAVAGTVRELIDDSFECRLRDLRHVAYEDGQLRFTARNGQSVFENTDMCDTDVMSSFSERDARAFVREFRKAKAEI